MSITPDKIANIYQSKTNTREFFKLTDFTSPGDIAQVSISPDGEKIAFLRKGQIWLMDYRGNGELRMTTKDVACVKGFIWSEDSQTIFFSGESNIWRVDLQRTELIKLSFDNENTFEVAAFANWLAYEADGFCIMNEDGSHEKRIGTEGRYPVFSKNGKMLSFIIPPRENNDRAQLWVMDIEGKNKIKLADVNNWQQYADWSHNFHGHRE
ncbi:MAG: hypothetical protein ABH952_04540 [Candidatus Omnitrophota bacterium]